MVILKKTQKSEACHLDNIISHLRIIKMPFQNERQITAHSPEIVIRLIWTLGILQGYTIFEHATPYHLPSSLKLQDMSEDQSKQMLCR